jgi:hypothetical protein
MHDSKMNDSNTPAHIFPTKSRNKHSKLVRYPVGAEVLSRALDGVPQHGVLSCTFTATDSHRRREGSEMYVLNAVYSKRARSHYDGADALARGVLDPRWEIWVFAVPTTVSGMIRQQLLETGLPEMLRPWMLENASIDGKTGRASIMIVFDEDERCLHCSVSSELLPDRR